MAVVSGILPDVKGARLAARLGLPASGRVEIVRPSPPGETPRLYGRWDARRYLAIVTAISERTLRLPGVPGGVSFEPTFERGEAS